MEKGGWENLVGRRVLIREFYSTTPVEVVILEVSPSGNFIKVKYESGHVSWLNSKEYSLVEVLDGR